MWMLTKTGLSINYTNFGILIKNPRFLDTRLRVMHLKSSDPNPS